MKRRREDIEIKHSICFFCMPKCRVEVLVQNDHLLEVREDPKYPFKIFPRGCLKRLAAKEWFYHPSRVNYPLKRVGEKGEGKWQPISWDGALDEIAEKLRGIKEKYGAEALATSLGTLRTADEYRSRFMNLFGSPNVMGHSQICFGPRSVIGKSIIGWFPHPNLSLTADVKCIMFLGREVSQSRANLWKIVRDLKAKGMTKFICVDPRYTASAKLADLWLQLRPGTDCALLLAMINIIIQEGLYDKEFVGKWCIGFDELAARVRKYSPERAEQITWVRASKIIEAARMYSTIKPAVIVDGMGLEQSANIEVIHARYILSAITGNLDVKGGEVVLGPHPKFINEREIELEEMLSPEQRKKQIGGDRFRLYSWSGNELIQENQRRVWGKPGGVQHSDNQAHAPLVYRAMITGIPYPVKALITMASNPMVKSPNTKLVYKALKAVDLHVVVDFWMTPTAELADYVFPAASWLERPYVYTGDNSRNSIYGGERALPCSIEGEYDHRTDFDFWRGLGIRLGQKEYWSWQTEEEAYDYRLAPLGLTFKEFLAKGGMDFPPPEYKRYERIGFATPTGKVELFSTILEKLGYDPLPEFQEPPESPVSTPDLSKEYPLILINGGRIKYFYHSEQRQIDSLRNRHPHPIVQINPKTAKGLGITDGDWIWVETLRGRVTLKCEYFDGIDPRVIHAEHCWWFPEEPGEEPWLHGAWKSNINVCIDDNPDSCSQITGTWPVRTSLCRVYKLKEYK